MSRIIMEELELRLDVVQYAGPLNECRFALWPNARRGPLSRIASKESFDRDAGCQGSRLVRTSSNRLFAIGPLGPLRGMDSLPRSLF